MSDRSDRGSLSNDEMDAVLAEVLREKPGGSRVYPLSFAQQRLWFVEQLEPGLPTYNMTAALSLGGDLDVEALDRGVQEMARRHAMLRAGFESIDGTPVQVVHGGVSASLDRRRVAREDATPGALERLLSGEAGRPFDLERPPLFRAVLWELAPDLHVLQLTIHHLVADRRSIEIWFEDVASCYAAYRRRLVPDLPPLPVQYGDYASWQRAQWTAARLEPQVDYWRRKLSSAPAAPEPAGAPARPSPSRPVRQITFRVPRAVSGALDALGRHERATPFITLLAAFQAVLARTTGQSDVVVGTPIANRPRVELEHVIGLFMNMLVLRTSVAGAPTFRQLVARARDTAVEAYAHQDLPFEQLVEALQPRRRSGRTPLFRVYFALQSSWAVGVRFEGLEASPIAVPVSTTAFDVNLTITQDADGLLCLLIYDEETLETTAAAQVADLLQALLARVADNPDAPVTTIAVAHATDGLEPLARVRDVEAYDLTPMQSGMLFHCLHAPHSGAYHVQIIVAVTGGDLDGETFRKAWQELAARHAVIRTSFEWGEREHPAQIVHADVNVRVRMLDWSDRPSPEHESAWNALLKDDEREGFDLSSAPLMRVVLVRVAPGRYEFLWSVHHLILDRWSAVLVLDELRTIYRELVQGRLSPPPTRLPYRDFIDWLAAQDRERAKAFWTHAFRGWSGPTPIGVGGAARPGRQQGPTRTARASLSKGSAAAATLRRFLRERRVTSGTLLAAAWALVLSRYGGQRDVVFGLVVSGRPAGLPGVEHMVGMCVNAFPVRLRMDEDATVGEWLAGVQETIASFREWEHSSLVDIQGWIDRRGVPLFESLFVMNSATGTTGVVGGDDTLAFVPRRFEERTNLPLTVAFSAADDLELALSYDAERFSDTEIERLLGHLRTVVSGMLAHPSRRVADLAMLGLRERQQLAAWNHTSHARLPHQLIHRLVEEQAVRSPQAVAVDDLRAPVTYAELDARASALAAMLRKRGVGPNVLVGISIERSVDMIVMVLGVLKAGGAYVPLDPGAPEHRLRTILDETAIRLVLTSERLRGMFTAAGIEIVVLDGSLREPAAHAATGASAATSPEDDGEHLAYVIYTSGSTGRPKGVMVTHRNLVHSTAARLWSYPEPVGRFLLLSPFVFDSAVAGIFWTLCSGGCLVLVDERRQLDLSWLASVIEDRRVTHLLAISGLYAELLEADPARLKGLAAVIVAGDACSAELVARHCAALPKVALYNEYGPTEATVWATVHVCRPDDSRLTVPIGRPIPNTSVWILDDRQRLVPPGVAGEIYIGGDGVAAGYLGSPDLTRERFPPNPFSLDSKTRLYRTGDRARYRDDGAIEFLGRMDDQVKVRGFRVEVGEVEAALMQHPAVLRAVVVSRGDASGAVRLVGFASARPGMAITTEALRAHARRHVPEYMVPGDLIVVEDWPTTPTGKIDRRALSDRPRYTAAATAGRLPRSPLEVQVAEIWSAVLKMPIVGTEDNFFDLGGHSLLATQVVARIRRAFGIDLPIATLFERPTMGALCLDIAGRLGAGPSSDASVRSRSGVPGPPSDELVVTEFEVEQSLRQLLIDGR